MMAALAQQMEGTVLLQKGADPWARNQLHLTAIDFARKGGNAASIRYTKLRKAAANLFTTRSHSNRHLPHQRLNSKACPYQKTPKSPNGSTPKACSHQPSLPRPHSKPANNFPSKTRTQPASANTQARWAAASAHTKQPAKALIRLTHANK